MEAWIAMADRQLGELQEQQTQIETAMTELRQLRDEVQSTLKNGK